MVCCGVMVRPGGNGITLRPDHAMFGSNSPVCRPVDVRLGGVSFPLPASVGRTPGKGKLTPCISHSSASESQLQFADVRSESTRPIPVSRIFLSLVLEFRSVIRATTVSRPGRMGRRLRVYHLSSGGPK